MPPRTRAAPRPTTRPGANERAQARPAAAEAPAAGGASPPGCSAPPPPKPVDARSSSSPKRPRLRTPPKRAGVPAPLSPGQLTFPERASGPPCAATAAGHFQYSVGDNLTPRFKIMRKLGEGTFGQVLECWDRRRGDYVAVKVIRAVPKYREAAMTELRVLRTLAEHDPGGRWRCARLLEWFEYRGHVCMVFERLGPSLFDHLSRNGYAPFPLDLVRDAARQLLEALAFLHSLGLVHTDLKPENVLQRGLGVARVSWPAGSRLAQRLPASNALCLIDFGSAAWDADPHAGVVSTRHYRAPEVVLGAGWSWPADLWSLGCLLVELLTGDALFATHENAEHVAMMERVLGPIPDSLLRRIPRDHEARAWFAGVGGAAAVGTSDKVGNSVRANGGGAMSIAPKSSIAAKKERTFAATKEPVADGIAERSNDADAAMHGSPPPLSDAAQPPLPPFQQPSRLRWPEIATSKKSVKAVAKTLDLASLLMRRGDPSLRPHLDTILHLLRTLLACEPGRRGTALQLLQHPFFQLRF